MSSAGLAKANSEMAAKPNKNAVTDATEPKQIDADVNRKFKFFGVIQALRSGRYPDNAQIDEALKYTAENSPVEVSKLSPDGQKLISDVCAIIRYIRTMLTEKNNNEVFQNFLHATVKSDIEGTVGLQAPVSKEDAKEGERAGEAFRTLIKLFLCNGEARKLFNDLGTIGQDIFADAASFTANMFISRLKKVLVECQRHRDYQDAMDFFLNAFESYKGHAKDVATQTKDNAKNPRRESRLATAKNSFRTLVERFANDHSTQPIAEALDILYTDVKDDHELRAWFSRLDTYVRKCLQEPGYVMKEEAENQARSVRDQGQRFFGKHEGKYKGHFDNLFKQIEIFFKAVRNDPVNKAFGEKWHTLVRDIFGAGGKLELKPHLWQDVRDPILPQLLSHVGRVPVPRIEFSDPTVDLVIENIAIDAQNLIPNAITIDASSHMTLSAYSHLGDEHHHQIRMQLTQIQSDMKGVKFSLRKKKGFPSLDESGTADILLSGKGLTVSAHVETTGRKTGNIFTVKSVKVKVHTLKFAIEGTKHDLAIKIFKPLATSLIKKQLTKAAEQGLRDGLVKLDQQLQTIRDAQNSGSELKSKFTKNDKGSTATNPNKGTFKLVTSRTRDSILPDLGDKSGWANHIDEREKTAGKQVDGTPEWHSAAFSIFNGKP